jgi:hypothetical protein
MHSDVNTHTIYRRLTQLLGMPAAGAVNFFLIFFFIFRRPKMPLGMPSSSRICKRRVSMMNMSKEVSGLHEAGFRV